MFEYLRTSTNMILEPAVKLATPAKKGRSTRAAPKPATPVSQKKVPTPKKGAASKVKEVTAEVPAKTGICYVSLYI